MPEAFGNFAIFTLCISTDCAEMYLSKVGNYDTRFCWKLCSIFRLWFAL